MIYFLVFCCIPIPIALASRLTPSTTLKQKFGTPDRLIHKVFIVIAASLLLAISTGFRVGTSFAAPRTRDNPAWFHSRAAFYCFIPMLEIVVVVLYAATRVDRRFYIPKQKHTKEEQEALENGESEESGVKGKEEGDINGDYTLTEA
jgi:hypothetical protein